MRTPEGNGIQAVANSAAPTPHVPIQGVADPTGAPVLPVNQAVTAAIAQKTALAHGSEDPLRHVANRKLAHMSIPRVRVRPGTRYFATFSFALLSCSSPYE